MILKTPIQHLFYKLFTLLIGVMYSITAYVAPSTETPIKPVNEDEAKLVFAALADPQISNALVKRVRYFDAAVEDLKNSDYPLDAVLLAGDIGENGLAVEYQYLYDKLSDMNCPFLVAEGNHDIRLRIYSQSTKRFTSLVNALNKNKAIDSFSYSPVINGYKFIILGSEKTEFEESYFTAERLAWLDSELKAENGHPTFVVAHQPLQSTHGLPATWNSPIDWAGSIGKQSNEVAKILQKYDNVIFITGHLHLAFGEYTFEKLGNVQLVNLPSLCVNNDDGEYNESGVGYIVEAYENEILFRARDLAKGTWLEKYDCRVEVK